jgi:hypothetical protein
VHAARAGHALATGDARHATGRGISMATHDVALALAARTVGFDVIGC